MALAVFLELEQLSLAKMENRKEDAAALYFSSKFGNPPGHLG